MNPELDHALFLRQDGRLKESNEVLIKLAEELPGNAYVNYQCAWSYDVLGEESKAAPYYENAIDLGLTESDLEGALLGLGSTYRTLGDYEKSQTVFLKGMDLFPTNKAIQVFYSMTLYNLNEHNRAMELLLKCIAETTTDEEILSYQKAITFYADKLDERF
ncbi:tetratricopeptide repeat protein [Psychrobacillus sp.]|uniref:tetratricopeptide repeat protein n=1 Tax=Psychrobacillus sp. TaxID=1871623 RepID=UPI0028BE96F0|nr:tetratricopeptide repeat protein [Psychrobacillus sp.]